jgi:hypothetical protein
LQDVPSGAKAPGIFVRRHGAAEAAPFRKHSAVSIQQSSISRGRIAIKKAAELACSVIGENARSLRLALLRMRSVALARDDRLFDLSGTPEVAPFRAASKQADTFLVLKNA